MLPFLGGVFLIIIFGGISLMIACLIIRVLDTFTETHVIDSLARCRQRSDALRASGCRDHRLEQVVRLCMQAEYELKRRQAVSAESHTSKALAVLDQIDKDAYVEEKLAALRADNAR